MQIRSSDFLISMRVPSQRFRKYRSLATSISAIEVSIFFSQDSLIKGRTGGHTKYPISMGYLWRQESSTVTEIRNMEDLTKLMYPSDEKLKQTWFYWIDFIFMIRNISPWSWKQEIRILVESWWYSACFFTSPLLDTTLALLLVPLLPPPTPPGDTSKYEMDWNVCLLLVYERKEERRV